MRARFCVAVMAGVVLAASASATAWAQDVNQIVRTFNAIVNPQDALRQEERARRDGRREEERYWRDYRAGLEQPHPERERAHAPPYRGGDRRGHEIGADEARRYEEESRRQRRVEEERYWRDYRAGLVHRADGNRRDHAIGAEEARRLEQESRRNRRFEEERYWREYRGGIGR